MKRGMESAQPEPQVDAAHGRPAESAPCLLPATMASTTTASTAKSSAEKLPAEVWLAITALLPQPTQDSPWPATLTALGGTDRFLHRVVRRSLYRKLFFFNPPASSSLDLPAFVLRCSQELQQDRDLCRSVREVVVHSREGEFGFKHSYPEFLTVMDPFHSILESLKSSKLRALALHKFVLTRLSHVALYGLRNLHSLELDFTYLSPLPETIPPPPTHLKRLHEVSSLFQFPTLSRTVQQWSDGA